MCSQLLDRAVVDDLASLAGAALAELLALYFGEARDQCAVIAGGIADGDHVVVAGAAHKLRGGSLTFGARRAAHVAMEIEGAADRGDLETVREPLLPVLRETVERTRLAYECHPNVAGKAPIAGPH